MVHLFDPEDPLRADPAESALFADLNPVQREAVAATEGPVLVVAGAGSERRGFSHIASPILFAISEFHREPCWRSRFTNKAAAEMKTRVGRLVGAAVKNMWVSTFHSACVRILRREAPRLGYRSTFTIYDAQDSLRAITLAVKTSTSTRSASRLARFAPRSPTPRTN